MAKLTGNDADVTYVDSTGGATDYAVKNWTLDWTADMLDDTDSSDSGYKSSIAGLKGATGSFTWDWDGSSEPLVPGYSAAKLRLYFIRSTDLHIRIATAYINSTSVSPAVDGIVTFTYSFQSTGAIEYATTTT